MMTEWVKHAIFYHIYPLGFCDAPRHNDFMTAPTPRLKKSKSGFRISNNWVSMRSI